jgi:alpha-2-macroglobulin
LIHIDGQDRLLAADGVEVTLVRENERYYWRWSDDGWSRQQSPAEQTVYTRVVNWDEGGRLNLSVPVEYGQYRIELRDPRRPPDGRHRFFAGWRWDGEQGRSGRATRAGDAALGCRAYAPQGMATLILQAPFDGHALITVEGKRCCGRARPRFAMAGPTLDTGARRLGAA